MLPPVKENGGPRLYRAGRTRKAVLVIRMSVGVPLELAEQMALERTVHAVLDPLGRGRVDWNVSFIPFLLMPGCMLEVQAEGGHVERRVLDTLAADEIETVLRQVIRRSRDC